MLHIANNFNQKYINVLCSLSATHNNEELLVLFRTVDIESVIRIVNEAPILKPEYESFRINIRGFACGVKDALKESVALSLINKNTSELNVYYAMLNSFIMLEEAINKRKIASYIDPREATDLCKQVEMYLLAVKANVIAVHDSFLAYVECLYNDPRELSDKARVALKDMIVDRFDFDMQTRFFLLALVECVTLDVADQADRRRALRQGLIKFFDCYVVRDKYHLNLDSLFDDEFLYLMDRSIHLVVGYANNLLADGNLQMIHSGASSAISDVLNRTDANSKRYYVGLMVALKYHYSYELINQSSDYKNNDLFNAYFNLSKLRESSLKLRSTNHKDEYAKIYSKLIDLYKSNAESVDLKVKGMVPSDKNNHQNLNERLNKFNVTNLASELGLKALNRERYAQHSIIPGRINAFNPMAELMKALQNYFQFLDAELTLRTQEDSERWGERLNSLKASFKELNQLEVFGFISDNESDEVSIVQVQNKKSKKMRKKNNKSVELAHDLLAKFYVELDFSQSVIDGYFNQMNELLKDESLSVLKFVMHGLMQSRILDAMYLLKVNAQIELAQLNFITAIGMFVGTLNALPEFPFILKKMQIIYWY